LEFIRGASDQIVATFANFKLGQGIPPTNLEGVTAVDLIWTADSWTSLIATDSVSVY